MTSRFLLIFFISIIFHSSLQGNPLFISRYAESTVPVPLPIRGSRLAINQLGYFTNEPKRAQLYLGNDQQLVELVHVPSGMVMLEIEPEVPRQLEYIGPMSWLDFSEFRMAGEYYLRQGEIVSAPFQINEGLYDYASWLLQRSFYLQRCGVELDDSVTGLQHAACHTEDSSFARSDSVHKADEYHEAHGGWHDAGDYGKYVATTAVTISRLLSTYLLAPEQFTDNVLNIPESGNGEPDILDELRVGLQWMLRMQRLDGAVYRKVSGREWIKAQLPEDDQAPRFTYGISSHETAKFAGTMALAARVYEDTEESALYLQSAEWAWEWLVKNPEMYVDWEKSDDSGSGTYLEDEFFEFSAKNLDQDDRLAAAIELFLTTGKEPYLEYIQKKTKWRVKYNLYEWKDTTALSFWHILESESGNGLGELKIDIRNALLKRADHLLDNVDESPLDMANQQLVWGSNKILAEEAITLLHAWRYTKEQRYFHAVINQLDYLFGRNPQSLSFVTGVGGRSVRFPVHLFGSTRQRTLPGLLVGGPNITAPDGIAPKNRGLMSYADHDRAYSVNESAIDYNSTLIALLETLKAYRMQVRQAE